MLVVVPLSVEFEMGVAVGPSTTPADAVEFVLVPRSEVAEASFFPLLCEDMAADCVDVPFPELVEDTSSFDAVEAGGLLAATIVAVVLGEAS